MKRSEQLGDLTKALAEAQQNFGSITKTGKNPLFKSAYMTFDDIVNTIREPLAKQGLVVTQNIESDNGKYILTTTLMHTSGQWIESSVDLILISGNRGTNEMQVLGSVITYMKRYALSAMLAIASDEDTDGNDKQQIKKLESMIIDNNFETIKSMANDGKSYAEIAKEFNVSVSSIVVAIKK